MNEHSHKARKMFLLKVSSTIQFIKDPLPVPAFLVAQESFIGQRSLI